MLEAIRQILAAMPHDLGAAILIVLHTADHPESLLPQILKRASKLPVSHPGDGEAIQGGHVYIDPSGFHMIVEDGRLRVCRGHVRTCTAPPLTRFSDRRQRPTADRGHFDRDVGR